VAINVILASFAGSAFAEGEGDEEGRHGYSLQLEEVVVTAQKRAENYMSVPVAVNAFTSEDMSNTGIQSIQGMSSFMPGVDIAEANTGSTQVKITIRGVESPNISSGQDPSVATFYDDSYMPRAVTSIPFTDIARTEVLKGPQGTLFGRNATAGVINIVPNKPSEEWEGFIKTRLGNYSLLRVEGMLNAPVSDSVNFRGNFFSHQRDGVSRQKGVGDDVRDEGFVTARMSVLWALSDDTELQLSADYEDRDEMPRATIGVGKYAYQGGSDPFSGKTAHDVVGQEETRSMYGISLKLDHSLNDRMSVFGVVSYRDWETTNLQDEDGTEDPRRYLDTNNIEDSDILYSEVRFNYVDDRVSLIIGGNYSQEEVSQTTNVRTLADSWMQLVTVMAGPEFGMDLGLDDHLWDILGDDEATYLFLSELSGVAVIPPSFAGVLQTESMVNTGDYVNWGVFGDLTYQLTDSVRIAAGLRYSNDKKDYSWQTRPSDLDWPVAPQRFVYDPAATGAAPEDYFQKFTASDSWSKTTGRLVVDWEFSEQAMTYVSYATGYKSGGFDGQDFAAVVNGAFAPEDMTSIEWGIKGDFFSNSLRLDMAIFHQELDGRQESVIAKDSPNDPIAQPKVISGDEETDGIELIVQWNVRDDLRLTGITTYRETDVVFEPYYNEQGNPAGGEVDSSSAETEYTLRFDWTPIMPVGYLLVHVDYIYQEDPGPDEDTAIFETGRWYFKDKKQLNARISWQNDNDTIELALWGNNLLDEERASNPGGFAAEELGGVWTTIDDPRTYGVDLRYAY
jgi:iron complex outermembrane receptor protein